MGSDSDLGSAGDSDIASLLGISVPSKPSERHGTGMQGAREKTEAKPSVDGRVEDDDDLDQIKGSAAPSRDEERVKSTVTLHPPSITKAAALGEVSDDVSYVLSELHTHGGEAGAAIRALSLTYTEDTDASSKTEIRNKLTSAYWNAFDEYAIRLLKRDLTAPPLHFLRCGLLDPTWIDKKYREMINDTCSTEQKSQNVYYCDQWLQAIGRGEIPVSSSDDSTNPKLSSKSGEHRASSALRGRMDERDAEVERLATHSKDIGALESELKDLVSSITNLSSESDEDSSFGNKESRKPYEQYQRMSIVKIQDLCRDLSRLDRLIARSNESIAVLNDAISSLEDRQKSQKDSSGEQDDLNNEDIHTESISIRQMTKMTIGRQGNHFPILHDDYLYTNEWGTPENIHDILDYVEKIDPDIFLRTSKGTQNRIVPLVLIVPGYGATGMCWQPFDFYSRATSPPRLVVPLVPRSLKAAVLMALADYRWQYAREKAHHYWMEEGLTGHYYNYFMTEKLKGEVKASFIDDYVTWVLYESRGVQKLHKAVREVFWRYIPFSSSTKTDLKKRGHAYSYLLSRDENRAMSDGY